MAMNSNGSRYLQNYINQCSNQEIDEILTEVLPKMVEIIKDRYANYFLQNLLKRTSSKQRLRIMESISENILSLAFDTKGTHSLQVLCTMANSSAEQYFIFVKISNHIQKLLLDAQGTHIVQKIGIHFGITYVMKILHIVVNNFVEITNNAYGVCMVKILITRFHSDSIVRAKLLELVQANLEQIIQNPFGNYAVQHSITTYSPAECQDVISRVLSKISQLSNHKFSSNVVERCIMDTNDDYKRVFIMEIAKPEIIVDLLKNKYGNFVVGKCFEKASREEYAVLYEAIRGSAGALQNSKYYTKWCEFLNKPLMAHLEK